MSYMGYVTTRPAENNRKLVGKILIAADRGQPCPRVCNFHANFPLRRHGLARQLRKIRARQKLARPCLWWAGPAALFGGVHQLMPPQLELSFSQCRLRRSECFDASGR